MEFGSFFGLIGHFFYTAFTKSVKLKVALILVMLPSLKIVSTIIEFVDVNSFKLAFFFVLILFDHATGVMASKRKGIEITSSGLRRLSAKIMIYFGSVLIVMMLPIAFEGSTVSYVSRLIADTTLLLYALTEIQSILENTEGAPMVRALSRAIKRSLGNDEVDHDSGRENK